MALGYRLRQGLRDLLAFTRPVDQTLLKAILSPAQQSLFQRMTHTEQLHSMNVLGTLLAQADSIPHDLKSAALLHDAGKSRYALNVMQRSLAVIVKRLLPTYYERWSAQELFDRWHAPFVVRRHHPRWSAELVRMSGGSERAVWLIEHHADPPAQWQHHPYYALLVRLQQADDAN